MGVLAGTLAATLLLSSGLFAQEAPPNEPDSDIKLAQRGLQLGAYSDAARLFERAAKKRGGACVECYLGAASAQVRLGEGKKALRNLERALQRPEVSMQQRSEAHLLRGTVFLHQAGKRTASLQQAEQAFRAALDADPGNIGVLYSLGKTVLRLGREEEGIRLLEQMVERAPNEPVSNMARRIIRKPHLAAETMAPEFVVTTLEGEPLVLSKLEGRIVLLDFWATWCPPCVTAVRDLRRLQRRYQDKPVVIVSISWDRDAQTWEEFIAANNMEWRHAFDPENRVGQLFSVQAIPAYFVIDADGAIRRKIAGGGTFDAAMIDSEISKLLREMAKQSADTRP